MGAPDILNRLQSLGLTVSADGDHLLAEPKNAITDEARSLIRQHKPEILALLKVSPGYTAESRSRGWLVFYSSGEALEVYILPEPTRAEVLRDYPGAIEATAIHEKDYPT